MTPIIGISPSVNGAITPFDLLMSKGTFTAVMTQDPKADGDIFFISENGFYFNFSYQQKHLIVERNGAVLMMNLDLIPESVDFIFILTWSSIKLELTCVNTISKESFSAELSTVSTIPPLTLIQWAREQNLVWTEEYENIVLFYSKVLSCFQTIQQKIDESGGYSQFWNLSYEGNKIVSRTPKKEVEIHPIIHCLLSDQALLSSFEIIPEYQTGIGNLDFLILGKLKNHGFAKVFVEFKNAHSQDLEKGLIDQLPKYMRNRGSEYGLFCVLNYKGEWFDEPKYESEFDLKMPLEAARFKMNDPINENIRILIFNLSKPKSASK